jgi:hypothetical protein
MSDSPDERPNVVLPPEGFRAPPRSYPSPDPDSDPAFADSENGQPPGAAHREADPVHEPLDRPVEESGRYAGSENGQYRLAGRAQQATRTRQLAADDQDQYGQQGARAAAGQAGYGEAVDTTRDLRISLWGSPQSGKTTFLAALRHTTTTKRSQVGEWNVYPTTPSSSTFMSALTHELSQGRFPQSTPGGVEVPLRWLFVGDLSHSNFVRRRERLFRKKKAPSRFVLDLVDVSGRAFAHDPAKLGVPVHVAANTMDRLAEADGFLYLFDPIGERDNRDSYAYVNRVTTELRHRAVMKHSVAGTPHHLRQHVSVCITKFDDLDVFLAARAAGFVTDGPDGMPRVLDKDAEGFFDLLCSDRLWATRYEQSARSADLIRKELRSVFGAENVHYFVSSSIGFYRGLGFQGKGSDFNVDDFVNVGLEADDEPRIRGPINPINVLEPLISLQQCLAGRE